MVDSNIAFIDLVSAVYYGGSGWLRAYQNDYVIDTYIKPAVLRRTQTAPIDKYHLHKKLASYCLLTTTRSVCCVSLFLKYICKTNTLDKKVRARGQFYSSYSFCSSKWLLT